MVCVNFFHDYYSFVFCRFPSGILFDGGRIIYSDKPLPGLDSDVKQDEAEFDDPISLEKRKVKYVVKHTGTRNTADIVNFMEGSNGNSICTIQDCLRVLDCASKLACNGPFISLGRMAIFDKSAVKTIANKLLSIHRGFVLTLRPQWKLRINIDMTFTAMFPSGNLADVLYDKYGDQMCPQHRLISRDIVGLRLLSPKIYRKNPGGIDFFKLKSLFFPIVDEPYARLFTAHGVSEKSATQIIIPDTKQSVQQYFESTYKVQLKYPYLPCIKVKKDRDVFYPMELLEVLPFQKPRANPDLAAEIIRCAAVRPGDRFGELAKFCRSLISQPGLQRYGIKIDPTMQEVNAREIDPPRANFGGSFEQLGRGKWQAERFYLPANANGSIRLIVVTVPPYRVSSGRQATVYCSSLDILFQYSCYSLDSVTTHVLSLWVLS
ncbi:unnamed protein product [Echinostoma caproni]|uniref:PAZ domain-containing protein n=1 Tax=Echinostoma caproni TaxID=27848 RepID=A0A183BFF8_9TREM|nr:unnamed protein product [Echinostoma caproni]